MQIESQDSSSPKPEAIELLKIPGGDVLLGTATDGSAGFVWDNEGPQQVIYAMNLP